MSAVAFAGPQKKKQVSFGRDVSVNGTVVKKGDYTLLLDEQTSELSIVKGSETIVKTTFQLQPTDSKAIKTEMKFSGQSSALELQSIKFDGSKDSIVIGGTNSAAKPQQ